MFDAMTGIYIMSIVNGTAMSLTVDPAGDLIGYYVNATAGTQINQSTPINDNIGPILSKVTTTGPTLNMWNSTLCIHDRLLGAQLLRVGSGDLRKMASFRFTME